MRMSELGIFSETKVTAFSGKASRGCEIPGFGRYTC